MPVGQYGGNTCGGNPGTGNAGIENAATGRATGAARGRNHGRASRAIAGAVAAFLLAAAPTPWTPVAFAQATPEENPLVQRGVPAEATAENAVVARDRALASGQRLAYDRMAAALGLPRGLSDSQIEAMVSSLVIESERITARGYSARITVNFNPQRVATGRAPGGAGAPVPVPGPGAPPPASTGGPAVATLDAVARYRSFPEWVEITRRLGSAPAVARVEVVTVAGDMARLRLGLRSQPQDAANDLVAGGLLLGPAGMDAQPGEGWRLGLVGSR